MADISIEFLGKQLQNIQAEPREMKFAAEVERRNSHSAFNNLVTEVGLKLSTFEVTIEHGLGAMDGRLEAMDGRLKGMQRQLDQGLGTLHQQLDRIEQLLLAKGSP